MLHVNYILLILLVPIIKNIYPKIQHLMFQLLNMDLNQKILLILIIHLINKFNILNKLLIHDFVY
jgi:hypothetical protein